LIIQGHQITKELNLKTHSVVVGSGAGGGVAAFHLAEAGVETVVLEEGGYFQARDFTQREDEMIAKLYRSGGQQKTLDGMISVLQGSAFGGTTLINTSDVTPIYPGVLEHWKKHFGIDEVTQEQLNESQKRVFEILQAERVPQPLINRNNDIISTTAKKLGYKSVVFNHNRQNCVGSGYCTLGCSYDAKRGTNLSYLPQASELGADIYTDVRVDYLERLGAKKYRVHATVLERGSRTRRLPLTIDAERIVLAAGTIHTPSILARSGFGKGLPQLGKNLTLQPQMLMGAFMDEPMISWRGVPQSVYLDEFTETGEDIGFGGFQLEGVGGVKGFLVGLLPAIGHEHKELMSEYPNMQLDVLITPDRPTGGITYKWLDDGTVVPQIDYHPTDAWKARLKRGMRTAGEFLFEAGAKKVFFGGNGFGTVSSPDELKVVDDFRIEPGQASFFGTHLQGTCRMGKTAETSVVDQNLQIHNLENIFVVDGSVMPTTAAGHTMFPIMTMADRAVHRMLEKKS